MHLNALSDILTLDLKVDLLKKLTGAKKHAAEMQEYLVFGMSKGSVYIVNTQKIDRIYARVTVTRAAVTAITYIEKSRLFASTCEESKLSIWSLDAGRDGNQREKRLTTLYQVKLQRPVKHLQYIHSSDEVIGKVSGDRFMFAYESGEYDLFEVEKYGPEFCDKRISLIETDKTKEHEQNITALDFHRNLNLIVSSCEGGLVKIWTTNNVKNLGDKQMIREITFPNKVDSVCFMNEHGDIMVAHDKRISVIKFQTYWPFRDERGQLESNLAVEPRNYKASAKVTEINESLFLNMKKKDDLARGGGSKLKKAQTQPQSPTWKKQVKIDAGIDEKDGDASSNQSVTEEKVEIDLEKPPSPMSLKAL